MVAEMTQTDTNRRLAVLDMVSKMKATSVVQARAMVAEVQEAAAEVEDDFKAWMKAHAMDSVTLSDGTTVTKVEASRRSIDADKLADITTATLFEKATTRKVVHGKFDALVEVGEFGPVLVDAVVTETPYTSVKVTYPKK